MRSGFGLIANGLCMPMSAGDNRSDDICPQKRRDPAQVFDMASEGNFGQFSQKIIDSTA
jgi:hypothetical protein